MVDGKKSRLDAVYSDGTCCFHDLVESEKGFESVKPILKPISWADDYVRSEFNKFDHVQECDNEAIDLFCFEKLNTEDFLSELDLSKLPYDSIQWLLKNHYDVFGLLDVSEAVQHEA
jgi:hypothetical protein